MTDEPQGHGWWQASDLKWYPPEQHADDVKPAPSVTPTLPPPPTQPPVTPKGPSGQRKVGFVLGGLALLAIAVQAVPALFGPAPGGMALAVVWGLVIIGGVAIAVRSDLSRARKFVFFIAFFFAALTGGWLTADAVHHFVKNGSSGGGAGSANSSSFCADFLNLWDGPQGVSSAIMAVQEADAAKEYRAHGWSNTALVTAAKNAETLAAEAPSDQLKTDFTNIAQTLSAHAHLDLTYHGTGNEQLEVEGSTATARCRLHMPSGH